MKRALVITGLIWAAGVTAQDGAPSAPAAKRVAPATTTTMGLVRVGRCLTVTPGGTVGLDTTCPELASRQGERGERGEKGDAGTNGAAGPRGPAGADGVPGRDGAPGAAGRNGLDGAAGPAGPRGDPGLPGSSGQPGKDGAAGPSGSAGERGQQGPPGAVGPAGPGSIVDLGQVTIGQTATVALVSGIRTVSVPVPGLLKDDAVVLAPLTPFPTGYLVGQPVARVAAQLDVPLYAPALVIGAAYSFKARILVIRP